MIDFPASPVVGQTFSGGTGILYVWDGVAWNVISNLLLTADRRNRIINPTMLISQENGDTASATGTSGSYYCADQWQGSWSLPGTANTQRGRSAPDTGSDYIVLAIGTASPSIAAGAYAQIIQFLEGFNVKDLQWGTANAKPVVLRFAFNTTVAGTYTACINNGAGDRSYLVNFAATVGWKVYSFAIPGDTIGTWPKDNTRGMMVRIGLAAGTTLTGVAGWQANTMVQAAGASNLAATAGAIASLTDVGLYVDANNTGVPPPFEIPDVATESIRCQRYWKKIDQYLTSIGYGNAGGQILDTVMFSPLMRTTPTMSYANPAYNNSSNLRSNAVMNYGVRTEATGTATGSAWAICDLIFNARS